MYYIYPILLCLLPVHSFYAQNIHEISVKDYINSLFLFGVFLTIGFFSLNFLLNNVNLSFLVLCVTFFFLLYGNYLFIAIYSKYQRTSKKNKIIFTTSFFAGLTVIDSLLIIQLKDVNLTFLNKVLFYISAILTFFILMDIISKKMEFAKNIQSSNIEAVTNSPSDTPDIYHIIADAHPGFSVPEYCDTEFEKELEKRGFHNYKKAKSNYNTTNLSVPSMLNMEYIQNLVQEPKKAYFPEDVLGFYQQNIIFNFFRNNGYNFNICITKLFDGLFQKSFFLKNDFFYNNISSSNKVVLFMHFSSIFKIFIEFPRNEYKETVLKPLEKFGRQIFSKPQNKKYTFMHIIAPHHPFYTDEFGKINKKENWRNRRYFFPYIKFIDKKLLNLIDDIQKNMKKNSVIILHSDHSLQSLENPHNILMSVYFPNQNDYKIIPEDSTLVNFYRFILNKYFHTKLDILENNFYVNNNRDFILHDYEPQKIDV